ncbi:MAG: hypothetical protein RL123_1282 [Pseudomonadota bacterium]
MSLFDPVDAYCERTDPSLWSEPVNALTNAAFLIAAAVMWVRLRGESDPTGRILCVLLGAIGVGSGLFHLFANRLTGIMDVVPILGFILAYVFAAHRRFWGQGQVAAGLWTLGFFPYAAVMVPLFGLVPGIGSSAGYAPVALLIGLHAVALRRRAPRTARGLGIGAGLLVLSLGMRTIDAPICAALPIGTHFLWHILNAIMLGWMIEVWRRHGGTAARGH